MDHAVGKRGIEDDLQPVAGDELAIGDDVTDRRLHPGIEREDPERRERGAGGDQHRGRDVHPVRHAVHAEQHHAEEGRLEEEGGQDLVGEQRPGDVADLVHEARPVGAELEGHGDAGDHAHRERQREDLGPQAVGREPLGPARKRVLHSKKYEKPRERNRDAREQDMEGDVQPELGAGEEKGFAGVHGGFGPIVCRTTPGQEFPVSACVSS